ncbi:hypothetical protein D7X99_24625 [Corallococcus sp. AB032C]|uniref:hypothetical protein n=1 Tax=Corallococcus TaxID=83461 RepID=UPI000EDFA64B|nr:MULTISPECIES: hypothetical protein [Corallococcus]NPC51227.1 hypothetical protein [Corallococcus exiguus]RKH79641.1 hypothetical protein D7X99_24625 [Corallococcus sp. AB032C]
MSQEALRSEPLPSSVDEAPADVPDSIAAESFPPLTFLLEEVRSPGMVRADIDALIVGLGRPPAPDEPLRERADLLLGLLDRSNPVGDYTGSGGMKVRHAAKEALLAMGYPYAMELPPELVEAKGADGRAVGLSAGNITLAVVSLLYQSGALAAVWLFLAYSRMEAATEVMLGIGAVLWLFTVLSLVGHHSRSRDMQSISSVVLWAAAVVWLLVALPLALFTNGVALLFVPWHLALWTAISLRPEAEEEEAPTKRAPPP